MEISANNPYRDIQARSASQKVIRKVIKENVKGDVISIFNHSFNIQTCDKFIINVGAEDVPLTPRSILLSGQDFYSLFVPEIYLGLTVSGFNGSIYFPNINLSISIIKASRFNPISDLPGDLLPGNEIGRNLIVAARCIATGKQHINGTLFSPLSGYFLSRFYFITNPEFKRNR